MALARSGGIEVCVRALQGFPDANDTSFDFFDLSHARVEVALYVPLRIDDENSSSPERDSDDTHGDRVHCVTRALADFVHLEKQLTPLAMQEDAPIKVERSINEYTECLASSSSSRSPFFSITKQTDRLLWQLESFLTETVLTPETHHQSSAKDFFGYPVVFTDEQHATMERCLTASAQEPPQETCLSPGTSFTYDIALPALMTSGLPTSQRVVVWKFEFAGEQVDFSATLVAKTTNETEADEDTDPYSEAAMTWTTEQQNTTNGTAQVLQYQTRYLADREGDVSWIYGAAPVPTCDGSESGGVVRLEWTNGDTTSIFSKPLKFQAAVCVSTDGDSGVGATTEDMEQLLMTLRQDDHDDWVTRLVSSSQMTRWPQEDDGDTDNDEAWESVGNGGDGDDQAALRQSELRARELESKVFNLEEELQKARQELKSTKSELEISSEVYKASLETIAHLELVPASRHNQQQLSYSRNEGLPHGGDDGCCTSYSDEDDDDHDDQDSEDEEKGGPENAETYRLRDLVATFQEQCLWRSIETTESEKRNLLMELEMARLDHANQSLTSQLASRDDQLATMQVETHKLKAQKALLVKEVKRLQPYAHVNLAALVHEAEEARMIQRSLQAQLAAYEQSGHSDVSVHHDGGSVDPETDHPVLASNPFS